MEAVIAAVLIAWAVLLVLIGWRLWVVADRREKLTPADLDQLAAARERRVRRALKRGGK